MIRNKPGILLSLLVGLLSLRHSASGASDPSMRELIADMAGPDAVAESRASQRLVELGDASVPALASFVREGKSLAPRLTAVELLGRIGTPAANDALIDLLKTERNLAVRGQICMQLGYAGDARAVPVIADWLKTIGPRAIDDVPGPKEVQPSTCYLRHIEALSMMGDERVIERLQEFGARIPPNVGYGGFVSNFVRGGVDEAIEEIQERAAFQKAIRGQPEGAQLEKRIAPLLRHLRRNPLARFRLHESELIRHTREGKQILQRLSVEGEELVAAGAKALLEKWDSLGMEGIGR